jgi:hypothetical protein
LRVLARQRRAFQRFLGENRQIAQDTDTPQFVQIRDFSALSRDRYWVSSDHQSHF